MTLCAQYTDNMKKRTLAQNGTSLKQEHPNQAFWDAIANTPIYYGFDFGTGENTLVLNKLPKPKRPRGKKVYSTDKMVKK